MSHILLVRLLLGKDMEDGKGEAGLEGVTYRWDDGGS